MSPGKSMEKYASGLQCKYCSHYRPWGLSDCDIYHKTDSVCLDFSLPPMEYMASRQIIEKYGEPAKRKDGSYVVVLSDVPSVHLPLLEESKRKQQKDKNALWILILITALVTLAISIPMVIALSKWSLY